MNVALKHIKKYNALNGTLANKRMVNKVLTALQKDITNKIIRKENLYANHIITIQNKLVNLVNTLNGEKVKMKIDFVETDDKSKPTAARKPIKPKAKPTKNKAQTELFAGLGALPSGFTRADQNIKETPDTFTLPGEIGKFMGNLQQYRLAISLTGDFHGGKSEFTKQLIDAFIVKGMTVGLFDLEQGGLISKDTRESIDRNIAKKHQKQLAVTGDAEKGLDTVKQFANTFDVVVIDSWQKLDEPTTRFDELRNEYPDTIFIVIFQQNAAGGTRGGSASDFDAPVALKANRIDPYNFTKNYVSIKKNRGNRTNLIYYIATKQTKEIENLINPKEDE